MRSSLAALSCSDGIVKGAGRGHAFSPSSRRAKEIRRLLAALPNFEFQTAKAAPLARLCAAGTHFGWCELERNVAAHLLANLSAKGKASLRRNLQRDLEWITRACFELERASFESAAASLGFARNAGPGSIERMFLGDRPSHRLGSLFGKFPVLPCLWCLVIRQWRTHVKEVLSRFEKDRGALSRAFFSNHPWGPIADAHFGLSDRHQSGRTVVRLQFGRDSIIYKPRSGDGESEWFSLLSSINRRGFQPKLRAARVLPRRGYCWMEYIESRPLKNEAQARRFFERMGGLIAAAYLLRAVDCHRENLIASGENPVLVDLDALWHPPEGTAVQSSTDLLYRTGFFPNANPKSLQSRSSAFRAGARQPSRYQREIARGFARTWACLLGTPGARQTFARQLRRIRSIERRRLYQATEIYAATREASIRPGALRSSREREALIRRRGSRGTVASAVIEAEVRALTRLDIPYFIAKNNQPLPPDPSRPPRELMQALSTALSVPI